MKAPFSTLRSTFIAAGLAITLAAISAPAFAFDSTLSRDQQVAYITQTYMPRFDSELARLTAIKTKMASDPSLLAQYNSFLADYNNSVNTVKAALINPTSDLATTDDFATEEVGEFDNTVYLLEKMAAKVKTITCVKGKISKVILGLSPVCPKGYTKKK
jgi:hypothetical protein